MGEMMVSDPPNHHEDRTAPGALQLIGKGFGLFVEREVVEERKVKPFTIEDFHEAAKDVQEWRKKPWLR